MVKIVEHTRLFNLGMTTSLGEGKPRIQTVIWLDIDTQETPHLTYIRWMPFKRRDAPGTPKTFIGNPI